MYRCLLPTHGAVGGAAGLWFPLALCVYVCARRVRVFGRVRARVCVCVCSNMKEEKKERERKGKGEEEAEW